MTEKKETNASNDSFSWMMYLKRADQMAALSLPGQATCVPPKIQQADRFSIVWGFLR